MRDTFIEWYSPEEDELETFVQSAVIALDANILLDLYRVGPGQRDEILSVLKMIGDRLFVPYQAALEYHRNRLKVMNDSEKAFNAIVGSVTEAARKAVDAIRDKKLQAEVRDLYADALAPIRNRHAELREIHVVGPDNHNNDPVRDALDQLVTGSRLGTRPSEEVLSERRAEADRRLAAKMPPGLGDVGKKDDPTGDALVWLELLDHAKTVGRPIFFITNDAKKDDWYRSYEGKTLGPSRELITEMSSVAGVRYHQTTLTSLLVLSNKYLHTDVTDETIEQVAELEPIDSRDIIDEDVESTHNDKARQRFAFPSVTDQIGNVIIRDGLPGDPADRQHYGLRLVLDQVRENTAPTVTLSDTLRDAIMPTVTLSDTLRDAIMPTVTLSDTLRDAIMPTVTLSDEVRGLIDRDGYAGSSHLIGVWCCPASCRVGD